MLKRLFLILMLSLISLFAVSQVSYAMGTFSEGCRMGKLTKFSVKGYVNQSGEGQLMLGRDGAPHEEKVRTGEDDYSVKSLSPWAFSSTDESKWEPLKKAAGNYMVLCYKQSQMYNPMARSTDYEIASYEPVTRKEPDLKDCSVAKPKTKWHDGGVRVGRIVKASQKGTGVKSFEIIIQQGSSGNDYFEMSLGSWDMYQCAMEALRSGKEVRLEYVEYVWNPRRDTNYDVYSITVGDDI